MTIGDRADVTIKKFNRRADITIKLFKIKIYVHCDKHDHVQYKIKNIDDV